MASFNTQPPEGGWVGYTVIFILVVVSTHSRPKAAGMVSATGLYTFAVSTHSRPKAAGPFSFALVRGNPCFNTQPPEGGWLLEQER